MIDTYVCESIARLKDLSDQIEALEADMLKQRADERFTTRSALQGLREKKERLETALRDVQDRPEASLSAARENLDNLWRDIDEMLSDVEGSLNRPGAHKH